GEVRETGFPSRNLFQERLMFGLYALGIEQEGRRWHRAGEMRVKPGFVDVVEEGEHPVEVLLADRVVFMVVAPCAAKREPKEGSAGGSYPVGRVFGAEFLFNAAALVGLAMEPVEGSGDELLPCWGRQQVTGQLPEDELV